jgi:hypothetical protein
MLVLGMNRQTQTPGEPGEPDEKDEFYLDILDGLARYLDNPFIADMAKAVSRYRGPYIANSLNKNQMASKKWLIDELYRAIGGGFGTGYILGGWNGVLAAMLFQDPRFDIERLLSIDIDPGCREVAETMNRGPLKSGRFAAVTADMYRMDYGDFGGEPAADILFNTSCEHLEHFAEWYTATPRDVLMVLQSNDMVDEEEHVNCVADLEAFKQQAPMTKLLFAGALPLKRYTRFMLIGRR